jgi:hypothetical protein
MNGERETREGSAPPGMRAGPFCVHLRSKKSFFLTAPPQEAADLLDASGH